MRALGGRTGHPTETHLQHFHDAATQLDRPAEHYQREQQPHPTREQRPAQHSLIISKPSRTAVPFNRLQLAAALIEYNDHQSSDAQISAIDWDIQELSSKPLATIKQAPYSAIFIPFRQSLPSKPPDFFSDIQLPARISEPVIIEDAAQATADRPGIDDDTEVLSEWGLDRYWRVTQKLRNHSIKLKNRKLAPNAEPKTGRDQEKNLGGTSPSQITSDQLNPVIDDEAMLRQRFGCDPEGRKLLRPQSVLELEETRQRYRQTKTSTTKQLAALRGRAPHPQQATLWPCGIQTIEGLATNSLPARGDEKPSRAKKSSANSATDDLSGPISPNQINSNSISELKSKRRTSADIANDTKNQSPCSKEESEDMTYDVPNQLSASLSGSMGSTRSEFSLGVPREFTSRFDPKVASVLSQATPTGMSLQDDTEAFENRSVRDDDVAAAADDDDESVGVKEMEMNDENERNIYDEHGRIRFPGSLKPLS
ncbi:hypothetical protein KEM48_006845 [Puccinia striiformis f. sp. tritici PST-130]|nr:hypothetical protein KEM48_006845 [Puccinia striiformis f. sp. tritici PST-130]